MSNGAWFAVVVLTELLVGCRDRCRSTDECRRFGACHTVEGQCRALTNDDCKQSEGCTVAGVYGKGTSPRCMVIGYQCVPVEDAARCLELDEGGDCFSAGISASVAGHLDEAERLFGKGCKLGVDVACRELEKVKQEQADKDCPRWMVAVMLPGEGTDVIHAKTRDECEETRKAFGANAGECRCSRQ